MELPKSYGPLIIIVVIGVIAGSLLQSYWISVLTMALFFAAFSSAWDFVYGLSGQIHFGPSLLVAIGGYTSGLLNIYTPLPLMVCIALGGFGAVLFGVLLALPALRMEGPFLGLVTLAATLLFYNILIIGGAFTGGEQGRVVRSFLSTGYEVSYYVSLVLVVCAIVVRIAIGESKLGIVLRALAQNSLEVELLGISSVKFKVGVFAVSAAFFGVGGALIVHTLGSMSPGSLLLVPVAITILVGAIFGGSGGVYGPAIGGFLLVLLGELLRPLGNYRLVTIALIILCALVLLPRGLTGTVMKAIANTRNRDGHAER